jgi:hypothetical protein
MKHPLLLLCSILVGLVGALLAAYMPESSLAWLRTLGLSSAALTVVIFAVAMLMRMYLHRVERRPSTLPDSLIRCHGLRFLVWFAGHSLFWVTSGSLCVVALPGVFKSHAWGIAVSAGLFACTVYALASVLSTLPLLFDKQPETLGLLGLCWVSSVPNGISNLCARASATMLLRERFEYAKKRDLKQRVSILRLMISILEMARVGKADRTVGLQEKVFTALKKEIVNRFFVLVSVFTFVCVLALLLAMALPPCAGRPVEYNEGWLTPVLPGETAVVSPSPDAGAAGTPQSGKTVAATPSPDARGTGTLQPGETVAATSSPDAGGTGTPQPGEAVAATPSPDAGGTGTPQPGEAVAATPSPDAGGTGTPQPSETVVATPSPGAGGTVTLQPGETVVATPSSGAGDTGTPQPGEAVAATPSPGAGGTGTPQPGEAVAATPSPDAGGTGTPQPGETVVATPSPGAGDTGTPQPGEAVASSPPPDAPASPSTPHRTPGKEPPSPVTPQPVPLPPAEPGEVITLTLLPLLEMPGTATPGAPTPGTPYPTLTPAPTRVPVTPSPAPATPVQHIPNWIWTLFRR